MMPARRKVAAFKESESPGISQRQKKLRKEMMSQKRDIFPPVAKSSARLIPFDIKGRTSKGNGDSNETYSSNGVPSKLTNPLPTSHCHNRCSLLDRSSRWGAGSKAFLSLSVTPRKANGCGIHRRSRDQLSCLPCQANDDIPCTIDEKNSSTRASCHLPSPYGIPNKAVPLRSSHSLFLPPLYS